jgi:hypothetical protein
MISGFKILRRLLLTGAVAVACLIATPRFAAAADPSAAPTASDVPTPVPVATAAPTPGATATPTAAPTATASPEPTAEPTPGPTETPTPAPTAIPSPTPTAPPPTPAPTPVPVGARAMNLFVAAQFRFQDPNSAACTATSVRSMLNFIAVHGTGGPGFIWTPKIWGSTRDHILAWERSHDTMTGGTGSDPHGWRNALNANGWGSGSMLAGARVYDDVSYSSYDGAMQAAVRALIATGKPVGLLGWRGRHAQMLTGYYGLAGNPFARDSTGRYANGFTVAGFFITDPLRASRDVNLKISYRGLRYTTNYRKRFQRYYQTDSLLDDPYTPGYRVSKDEWYGRYVLILPIR